jgi:C1A family cysteine protease
MFKYLFFLFTLFLFSCQSTKPEPAPTPTLTPTAMPTPPPMIELVTPEPEIVPVRSAALADVRAIIESRKERMLKYVRRPVLSTRDTRKLKGQVSGLNPMASYQNPMSLQEAKQHAQKSDDVDLRSLDTAVKNQGQEGLCTSFATVAAMESDALIAKKPLDLSERHLWNLYRQYYTEKALTASTKKWVTTEARWPYSKTAKPRTTIAGVAKNKSYQALPNFPAVYTAIASNKPVVLSVETNTSWSNPYKGVLAVKGTRQGGHAVKLSGFFDTARGRYLIIKNSWGSAYGDAGYVYLPENYCASYWCAFHVVNGTDFK